jgi:nucleoside 2-deoxyribosyltransferase
MTKPLIYLAGPITGYSYEQTVGWRNDVTKALGDDFLCFSPMRHKEHLQNETSIKDTHDEHIMSTQRSIFGRDMYDVQRSDALFVNLLGATRVSIGTIMELTLAWYLRHPVIICMEDDNVNQHAMVRESTPWVVRSVEEGISVLKTLYLV